jgi:hypothetical protein
MSRTAVAFATLTVCSLASLAAAQSPPPTPAWNITDKQWTCSDMCGVDGNGYELAGTPTPIVQTGVNFQLTNPQRSSATGVLSADHKINVAAWDLTAVVSDDLKTITFSDGQVWQR